MSTQGMSGKIYICYKVIVYANLDAKEALVTQHPPTMLTLLPSEQGFMTTLY